MGRTHCLAVCLAALTAAVPVAAEEGRVIDRDERVVPVLIDGEEIAMEIAPDAPNSPVLAAETAARLGLKGSIFKGVHLVGRTKLTARSNRVKIDFGDGERKTRRAFFFDGEWHGPGKAMINPASLPDPVVTYRLGEPREGETIIVLPLVQSDIGGYFTHLTLGEEQVPAFFTFARRETMATAAAGALLADAFYGRLIGDSRRLHIEFGIERPVRPLDFATPAMLGDLPLANVVVRTQDTGSIAEIPDGERDPNEIVVAGSKDKPLKRLWVGTDTLDLCSSLIFDRETAQIRLSCRFD